MDNFKSFLRVLLSVILCFILCFGSFFLVFADDDLGVGSDPGEQSPGNPDVVTFDPIVSDNQDVLNVDNALRQSAQILAAASSYTANDIYILLASVISNNKVNVYDNSVYQELILIYNQLHFGSLSVATMLQQLYVTVPDILSAITSLNSSIGSSSSGLSLFNYIALILDSLYDTDSYTPRLDIVTNRLDSLLTQVTYCATRLLQIQTNTSNLATISSHLNSIKNYLSPDPSWTQFSGSFRVLNDLGGSVITSSGNYPKLVLEISNIQISNTLMPQIYKIQVPFRSTSYNNSNDNIYSVYCKSSNTSGYVPFRCLTSHIDSNSFAVLYIYDLANWFANSNTYYIVAEGGLLYENPSWSASMYYNSSDASVLINRLSGVRVANETRGIGIDVSHIDSDIHSQLSILDRFKELYASDDLIQAKEDQQSYEDQALSDFTGEGSAAASGQDLGSASGISSALKEGLNAGGSVNTVLGIFDPDSPMYGLWGWFTQSNYDNINNLYNPNPSRSGLRSSGSQLEVLDLPYDYDELLQFYLDGGN